jgi:hypothetical protein
MTHRQLTSSILLAGLMAAGGFAQAQSGSASATTNVPGRAGEASTMTQGVPNAQTTNTPSSGATSSGATMDHSRTGAHSAGASATTSLPPKAGEASTSVQGRPNANPNDPMVTKSAAERRTENEMKKADARQRRDAAVMGQKGAQSGAEAGTPYASPSGNPSVFKGGTPK